MVFVKEFAPPSINCSEILRYMGCRVSDSQVSALIEKSLVECEGALSYKVCYTELDINICGSCCDFGFAAVESESLSRCLAGCSRAVLFGATIGLGLDRLILKYGKSEPSVSVCLQAIGAERIEALCDDFCLYVKDKYSKEQKSLRPRFSAGYGDLSLSFQHQLFSVLDCSRQIGLTLNDSLIMSPSKSVTGIIGIY